jgi:CheY-like chemotaxis protein
MMPKMDGVETAKIIRDFGYTHSIVALSANAVVGQTDAFLQNGFDDVISKPIDVRQLNLVLNKLIRDKQPPEVIEAAKAAESSKSFQYSNQRWRKNAKLVRVKLPYARVLVVDDNATNLDVAMGFMKPYDMQVDTVTSGQQAIDVMQREDIKYNAIFMDHMMPGMDGIEALEKIRKLGTDYAKEIPIIILTANAIAGNEKMFLDKGFQDYLSKPIDILRLDAVIRRWVQDESQNTQSSAQGESIEVSDNGLTESAVDDESSSQCIFNDFQIDGLDLETGLDRFDGDRDAYLKVLRSFAANTRKLLGSIAEVRKEDLKDYAITVHGIKGSCRSICANFVGDLAEALENAAKENDFEYVSEKAPGLMQATAKLLADLDEMLVKLSAQIRKPVKPAPDKDVLLKILEACKAYDMQTVEACLKELENYEYETGGELVPWLWENVQQFNVDEIVGKLSGI